MDQFLEHLIKIGITKVIRVGGQSQSELLENHNLRKIAQDEVKTKTESYEAAMAYRKLDDCEKTANKALGRVHGIHRRADWSSLSSHLSAKYPTIHRQLRQEDEDGFTIVGPHPFDIWKGKGPASDKFNPVDAESTKRLIEKAKLDVHSLSRPERGALLAHWLGEVCFDTIAGLSATVDEAASTHVQLMKIHDEADRRVLQGADVIGVTTSGLAKRISVLQHVPCKVIICEEAGEVMEPHMISALLPSVKMHNQRCPENNTDYSLRSNIAYRSVITSSFVRLSSTSKSSRSKASKGFYVSLTVASLSAYQSESGTDH